ncbi:MAG: TIGR04283 family arsenosugar biosynthesis glycosyltransferase [Pirellulales bacterium]|nr:TIGR04283 family arsenosugar biosynthesis glycosyltransferase [Pirellulales bacterium]
MDTLSVIIPTLNEEPLIVAAVERAWRLQPHEVLVVDGGSSDQTASLAEAAGAVVLHAPRGRGVQQNTGARQAGGSVLLFLHADTWLPPPAAVQLKQALCCADVAWGAFQQRIEARGRIYRWLEAGNAWRARVRGIPYGDQGIFVRRAVFERAGGFPEVPFMEDVLLSKLLRRKTRPVLLPGPIHVNPRRWQRRGVVRQTLLNWSLLALAAAGMPPERLVRWYR